MLIQTLNCGLVGPEGLQFREEKKNPESGEIEIVPLTLKKVLVKCLSQSIITNNSPEIRSLEKVMVHGDLIRKLKDCEDEIELDSSVISELKSRCASMFTCSLTWAVCQLLEGKDLPEIDSEYNV